MLARRARSCFSVDLFKTVALLALHAGFNLAQLAFPRKQLLPLLVDLALYLDLDLTQLLFLTAKLLFLKADRLVGKVLGIDGRILGTRRMSADEIVRDCEWHTLHHHRRSC